MMRFVQQNDGALDIINRNCEEVGIERDDLEGEVCRRVSVAMADPGVPPAITRAVADQIAQHKSAPAETSLLKHINCACDDLSLLEGGGVRSRAQRELTAEEKDGDQPDD